MSLKVETRRIVRLAETHGFVVEETRNNHLRFLSPSGEIIVGAKTPSDPRSHLNLLSQLRRAGLQDRAPKKKKKKVVIVERTPQEPAAPRPPSPSSYTPPRPKAKPAPWADWTDAQRASLLEQGYSREFVHARTGR